MEDATESTTINFLDEVNSLCKTKIRKFRILNILFLHGPPRISNLHFALDLKLIKDQSGNTRTLSASKRNIQHMNCLYISKLSTQQQNL